jgi:ELWxxDGT repeat protein
MAMEIVMRQLPLFGRRARKDKLMSVLRLIRCLGDWSTGFRLRNGRTLPRLEALEDRLLPSLTPHLLKDINPGSASSAALSGFVEVNGVSYFRANDGVHGTELWRSNGTAAGTFLVQDIIPGSASSVPDNLTNVNGTLFFTANDGRLHRELWRSNGTAAGTALVKDFTPSGPLYSDPGYSKLRVTASEDPIERRCLLQVEGGRRHSPHAGRQRGLLGCEPSPATLGSDLGKGR